LQRLRAESEQKLTAAEAERKHLLSKVTVLGGTAAEANANLEAQQVAEQANQVRLLSRLIARRMMYRNIRLGWTAWIEMWEARSFAYGRLREVAARLQTPDVAHAFFSWHAESGNRKRKAVIAELERESKSCQSQLRQARFETGQLEMRRVAQDDELTALRERVRLLSADVVAKEAGRAAAERLSHEHRQLKERCQTLQEAVEVAQRGRADAEEEAARQRKADQSLLETLLSDQRKSVEQQMEHLERELYLAELQRGQLQSEASTLAVERTELTSQCTSLDARCTQLQGEVEEERKHLKSEQLRLEGVTKQLEQQLVAFQKSNNLQRVDYDAQLEELRSQLQAQTDARNELETLCKDLESQQQEQQAKQCEHQEERRKHHEDTVTYQEEIAKLQDELRKLEQNHDEKATLGGNQKAAQTSSPLPARKKEKAAARSRSGPLEHIDLEEGPGAPPISGQIANALRVNAARVLDLFRSWDSDSNGMVTRAEFHKAMPLLGLEVPKAAIDELFSSWDKDGEGTLTFKELTKILRQTPTRSVSVSHASKEPSPSSPHKSAPASATTMPANAAGGQCGLVSPV